jgi:uncharacterized protein YndB with AHSA1/START domain
MSRPEFIYVTYIETTPEKLWEALTSSAFSERYWWGTRVDSDWKAGSPVELEWRGKVTEYFFDNAVEVDLKIGGAYIVRTPDDALHISGEVIECDPPRKLTVTFNVNWPALIEKLGPTLVTYEIEPAGNAGKLTMTEAHDRPISDDILSGGRQGWPAILSSLKSLLETGEPLVIKMQPPRQMLEALKELGIATP